MEGTRLLAASEVCHAEADSVVSFQFTVLSFHPTEAPVSDGDAGGDRLSEEFGAHCKNQNRSDMILHNLKR